MIILVTYREVKRDRSVAIKTSHGYDVETGRTIITSNESPHLLGAVFDEEIGEWVLE